METLNAIGNEFATHVGEFYRAIITQTGEFIGQFPIRYGTVIVFLTLVLSLIIITKVILMAITRMKN